MTISIAFVFVMCFPSASFYFIKCTVLSLTLLHGVEFFIFFFASVSTFWALWASTPLVKFNTCLLVISFASLTAVSYPVISVIISSSFMPFMNCSFDLLSLSLYLHSFAFILRWPIHSWELLLCSLINIQYCYDNIVSLLWGLNLSLNSSNNLVLILHFSCA